MTIVINKCWGGFALSDKAREFLHCDDDYDFYYDDELRADPRLVECIRTLDNEANGQHALLGLVEIPDDATDWEITEYDGMESVIYVVNGKIHHMA